MEPPTDKTIRPMATELGRFGTAGAGQNELTVFLKSGWVEITAHLDKDGLHELIGMLEHYEAIMVKPGGKKQE